MYRRKEILLIIVTLLITFLYFLFTSNPAVDNEKITSKPYVNVKVEGEVKKEVTMMIPIGYTYGYVINKVQIYFNDYSYHNYNLYEQIYEDITILILSTDINNKYDSSKTKISVNKASFNELLKLYGVGEKRANKIIEYRKIDKIDSFAELQKILGVSDEVINKIKSQAIL